MCWDNAGGIGTCFIDQLLKYGALVILFPDNKTNTEIDIKEAN